MIASVILAAGESSRMGRPKAFLKLGNSTFLDRIATSIRAIAVEERMIAVSQTDDKILKACQLYGMTPVLNATAQTAVQLGSIQAALAKIINRSVDGLLVWPVDFPHVTRNTGLALVSAFLRSGKAITVPVVGGRRGHPVIFRRPVFDELLSTSPTLGARAVVRADPSRVLEVDVDDQAILEDIDTPEAYEDLLRRHELGTLPI